MSLTNQQQIARALHRATGCGYQKAQQRVKAAADAGLLPPVLDRAGREQAVRILTQDHTTPTAPAAASGAQPGHQGASAGANDHSDLLESMRQMHLATEAYRGLKRKEEAVEAMRAERDRRSLQDTLTQVLGRLERGGEGKTVTGFAEVARALALPGNRVLMVDTDPSGSFPEDVSLAWVRQAAAQLPEPGYESVIIDAPTTSTSHTLTPREQDELLRQLGSGNPQ